MRQGGECSHVGDGSGSGARALPDVIEWRSLPAAEVSWKLWLGLLAISAAWVLGFMLFNLPVGFAAAALVFISMSRFFFPTYYRLSPDGISVRFARRTERYEWSRFRRIKLERHGLLLSPFTKPSVLDEYRGLYIRCTRDNRELVSRYVARMLERHRDAEGC